MHDDLIFLIIGSAANNHHSQAYLVEGLGRWNLDRRLQRETEDAAVTAGKQTHGRKIQRFVATTSTYYLVLRPCRVSSSAHH